MSDAEIEHLLLITSKQGLRYDNLVNPLLGLLFYMLRLKGIVSRDGVSTEAIDV
jgi:hypothetical protein